MDSPIGEIYGTPMAGNDQHTKGKRKKGENQDLGHGNIKDYGGGGNSSSDTTDSFMYNKKSRNDTSQNNNGGEDKGQANDIIIVEDEDEVSQESEMMKMIRELEGLIKKARGYTAAIDNTLRYSKDMEDNFIAMNKAGHLEKNLVQASEIARKLESLIENQELKEVKTKWANKSAQCSPAFVSHPTNKGVAGELNKRSLETKEGGLGTSNQNEKKIEAGDKTKRVKKTKKKKINKGNRTEREEDSESQSEDDNRKKWTLVDRKKREEEKRVERELRKTKDEEERNRKKEEDRLRRVRQPLPPPKSEAILVKATNERTYADLFKKLKTEAADKMQGIQMVRRSRGGDLILELDKNANHMILEDTVKATLGSEFAVRKLTPKVTLEIKDLDPSMDKEEIRREIARSADVGELGESEIEMKSLRFGYGGTKTAIVALPTRIASKLGEENKIKVGFTICRINRTANIVRCYKCHAFGHMSYGCKEKLNGKEICRRCGTEGHQINGCNATRCCVLCIKQGVPAANAEHVAGAVNCPQNAQHLLAQTAVELKADVVLIADPLCNPGPWIYGKGNRTAIWITGMNGLARFEDADRQEEDFTAVQLGDYVVVSIYLSPSLTDEEYSFRLERVMDFVKENKKKGKKIVLGGDLNAHASPWGSKTTNSRGRKVLEELWKVLDIESDSDHRYVLTTIEMENNIPRKNIFKPKWRTTTETLEKSKIDFSRKIEEENLGHLQSYDKNLEKTKSDDNLDRKRNAWWNMDLGLLRNNTRKIKRKIQRVRAKIKKKGKGNEELEILEIQYKDTIKELRKKITKAKADKWREFCEELNRDVWGKPYKSIMSKVKATTPPATLTGEFMDEVLRGLFPRLPAEEAEQIGREHSTQEEENLEATRADLAEVREEEIRQAAIKIAPKKAAGLDGISPGIIRELALCRPDTFAALFTGILRRGIIPEKWKSARTVLLRKPGKDPSLSSAYRPICIIDAVAKLFEYVIKERLMEALGENPFEKVQYGFVKGRSTVQAMYEVRKKIRSCINRQKYSVMIALDIRNAFNTLRWSLIRDELKRRNTPEYLQKIIANYFEKRKIWCSTIGQETTMETEMGVPQGSVLGPLFWNLVYDGLLRKSWPIGCSVIAFADDILILVESSKLQALRSRAEEVTKGIGKWLRDVGLELAINKTEVMFTNRKRIPTDFVFRFEGADIKPAQTLKYLGVEFDSRGEFRKHIQEATNKGIRVMAALSRVMANQGGLKHEARRLYFMVLEAIVMYGAPIWAGASRIEANWKILKSTQRLGLARVASAYRTVPMQTLAVLTGVVPWDIKIRERENLFKWEIAYEATPNNEERARPRRNATRRIQEGAYRDESPERQELRDYYDPPQENRNIPDLEEFLRTRDAAEPADVRKRAIKRWLKKEAATRTLEEWQEAWTRAEVGRWTHTLIPNIEPWINRKHGCLNFYMTQALTGHGVFNKFRKKIGKTKDSSCWFHPNTEDSPEHTIFQCQRWEDERKTLEEELDMEPGTMQKEELMGKILQKEKYWQCFSKFCTFVLKRKEEEERRRGREEDEEESSDYGRTREGKDEVHEGTNSEERERSRRKGNDWTEGL
ncbi:uncharacterized protein LOC143219856 [Lasioglossum baleicum]|uniref:uncharacterized protein LOC143219856 n=1 Tax=Lasioglossum baleicum TaxID=434251 RepID=UPI003FCE989C